MKQVCYYGNKNYLITNKEFEEALRVWQAKGNYFCHRLETILSDKYIVVETPKEDLGYEVFLSAGKFGGIKKIFKKGDKYFQQISLMGGGEKKAQITLSPDKISALILQEKYYEGKKRLAN